MPLLVRANRPRNASRGGRNGALCRSTGGAADEEIHSDFRLNLSPDGPPAAPAFLSHATASSRKNPSKPLFGVGGERNPTHPSTTLFSIGSTVTPLKRRNSI